MLPRFVPVGDGAHVRPARGPDRQATSTRSSRAWRSSTTPSSGSRATPTSPSPTRPTTSCGRSRTSCAAAASARSCGSRSAPAMSATMREQIAASLDAEEEDVFEVDGLLDLRTCGTSSSVPGHADLRDPPWTPVTQPRLQPDEDEEPDVMAAMRKGDILAPPPLRLVLDLGRALRRAGRRRPRRARDQADRVPHERRLAARPGADPRRRARQAGGLRGGGQGALRRAGEHPLGARARAGGRARRARPAGAQDARQVPADHPPRGRRRAPLRARRDRQLPPEDGAPVHGLRAAHLRRARSAPTSPTCSTSSPASRARAATARCSSRPRTCATGSSREIERDDRGPPRGQAARGSG